MNEKTVALSERFYIACTTCSARLKVRNDKMIGQIYPCPKCGSMVLIADPSSVDEQEALPGVLLAGVQDSEHPPTDTSSDSPTASGASSPSWLLPGVGSLCCLVLVGGFTAFLLHGRTPTPGPDASLEPPHVTSVADSQLPPSVTTNESSDIPPTMEAPPAPSSSPTETNAPPSVELQVTSVPTHPLSSDASTTSVTNIIDPLLPEDFQREPKPAVAEPVSLTDLATLLEGVAAPEAPSDTPEPDLPTETPSKTIAATLAVTTSTSLSSLIDIETQMSMRLRSLEFAETPLLAFARFVSELTNVPVQFDARAFRQTGTGLGTPITFRADDISAADLLRQGLQSVKLDYVAEDQVIRITSLGVESEDVVERKFFVGDLQRTNKNDLDLIQLIAELVEPYTWSTGGGHGSIEMSGEHVVVRQNREVHVQTVFFLEKLRLARGLRPRTKAPASFRVLETKWQQAVPKLEKNISINAWQAQPFGEVLKRIEQASEIHIIVDWKSLLAKGWSEKTESTLVVRDASVEASLRQLLDAAGLIIRPLDSQTIEITTQETDSMHRDLEFYHLDQIGPTGLTRLKQLMISGLGKFAIDSASDSAIVVAPASVHRDFVIR